MFVILVFSFLCIGKKGSSKERAGTGFGIRPNAKTHLPSDSITSSLMWRKSRILPNVISTLGGGDLAWGLFLSFVELKSYTEAVFLLSISALFLPRVWNVQNIAEWGHFIHIRETTSKSRTIIMQFLWERKKYWGIFLERDRDRMTIKDCYNLLWLEPLFPLMPLDKEVFVCSLEVEEWRYEIIWYSIIVLLFTMRGRRRRRRSRS